MPRDLIHLAMKARALIRHIATMTTTIFLYTVGTIAHTVRVYHCVFAPRALHY